MESGAGQCLLVPSNGATSFSSHATFPSVGPSKKRPVKADQTNSHYVLPPILGEKKKVIHAVVQSVKSTVAMFGQHKSAPRPTTTILNIFNAYLMLQALY